MKLIKNADPDKYGFTGYGIVFNEPSQFLFSNVEWGKDVVNLESIIDFLCMPTVVLGEGLIDELDNATTTVELNILLILPDQKKV